MSACTLGCTAAHLMGLRLASSSCSSLSSASRLASASPRVLHHFKYPSSLPQPHESE